MMNTIPEIAAALHTYTEFIYTAVSLPYQTLGNWSLPLYILAGVWILTKVRVDL